MIPDPIKCASRGRVLVEGSFRPNGAGAIDNTLNTGAGFTVARTAQGVYTITLDDKYVALSSAWVCVALVALDTVSWQLGAVDVSGAKTVQVRVWGPTSAVNTTAAAFDPASDAANRIYFGLVLRKTTVGS